MLAFGVRLNETLETAGTEPVCHTRKNRTAFEPLLRQPEPAPVQDGLAGHAAAARCQPEPDIRG